MSSKLFSRLAVIAAVLTLAVTSWAAPRAEHVFIISIDGGKPAVIQQCPMPALQALVQEGAHTWVADTIFPSLTLPSHTSMLTGVGPEKHHILWNDWEPAKGVLPVTTVFAEAKKAGFSTAMIVGKEKFRHFLLTNTVDVFDYDRSASQLVFKSDDGKTQFKVEGAVFAKTIADHTAACILTNKPNLCFIHLTDVDVIGHRFGWGTPEQKTAMVNTDEALGVITKAIRDAGIASTSVVLLTADHGGHGHGHGSRSPEDMHIPWIAWGKGVKKGFEITQPVNTCDTAATALWLLDVPVPASFDGHPVTSAFEP